MSSKTFPTTPMEPSLRSQNIAKLCQETSQFFAMLAGLEQTGQGDSELANTLRSRGAAHGQNIAMIFAPPPAPKKAKPKAKGLAKTAPTANAS